jgi:Ala-tRNA(Pro) deacylase
MTQSQEKLTEMLRREGAPFVLEHHRPVYTGQTLAAVEHVSGDRVAKVVVLLADRREVMVVVPASHRVDLDRVKAKLGADDVRLAEEREFADAFPDCEVGAMPPFGNLYRMPLYVDAALAGQETITFPAGTHSDTLRMRFADFARIARPTIGDFSHHM